MTSETFTPITTQEELDRIIQARVSRVHVALRAEREHARKWEKRAKQNSADADVYRREARRWEDLAKQNLAVIQAHEGTIARFVAKLDDVLNEED